MASELNIKALHERPAEGGDPRPLPLEVETDRMAAFWIINQAFQPHTPYLATAFRLDPPERIHRIRLTLVLTASFWAHSQRIDAEIGDAAADLTHPPPLMRLHVALSDSAMFLRGQRGLDGNALSDLNGRLIADLDRLTQQSDWFAILHPDTVFADNVRGAYTQFREGVRTRRQGMEASLREHRFFVAEAG